MEIPSDYPDALTVELAPFGFEFTSVTPGEDGGTNILFEAEPDSFVRTYPELGIEESYGDDWPPARLQLWLRFDSHGDPIEITFEVFDLLAWAASVDPQLHARLNTMEDPAEQAIAVGEAMARTLEQEPAPADDYFE